MGQNYGLRLYGIGTAGTFLWLEGIVLYEEFTNSGLVGLALGSLFNIGIETMVNGFIASIWPIYWITIFVEGFLQPMGAF